MRWGHVCWIKQLQSTLTMKLVTIFLTSFLHDLLCQSLLYYMDLYTHCSALLLSFNIQHSLFSIKNYETSSAYAGRVLSALGNMQSELQKIADTYVSVLSCRNCVTFTL